MGSSASTAAKPDNTIEGCVKDPASEASPLPVLIHSPLLSCFSFLYSPFSALFSNPKADPRRKTGDALKVIAADRRAPNPRTSSEPGEVGKPHCFCPHAKYVFPRQQKKEMRGPNTSTTGPVQHCPTSKPSSPASPTGLIFPVLLRSFWLRFCKILSTSTSGSSARTSPMTTVSTGKIECTGTCLTPATSSWSLSLKASGRIQRVTGSG